MSLEVIHDTGSYTGNGGTQTITIGWQPAAVIIVSARSGGPPGGRGANIKTTDMAGDQFFSLNTDAEMRSGNGVTLTSTGFSLGSDQLVNHGGETFHWWAIRESGALQTGVYTGDGVSVGDTQDIPAGGRQPEAVWVVDITTAQFRMETLQARVDGGLNYAMTTAWVEDSLSNALEILSDGFRARVGSGFSINDSGDTYCYLMFFKEGATRSFVQGKWTETGSGSVAVAVGFQPKWVLTNGGGGSPMGFWKSNTMPGDDDGELGATYDWVTSGGITLTSTGFSAGVNANVRSGDANYFICGYL